VFSNAIGEPLDPHGVFHRFKTLMKRAGLRSDVRFYDLRHTCAKLAFQAGVNPKVVSGRLGHASIILALDTYSHVLPDMQQAATEKLAEVFGGSAAWAATRQKGAPVS
jgi:integrase